MQGLFKHAGCDQGNPALGDTITPRAVIIMIYTNYRTLRDHTATINDGFVYGAAIQNLAFGQDQRIGDVGI